MILKVLKILVFGIMLAMNYLANALPLAGKTTGEISAQYSNLFVPAGITFSIWGVIYILILFFIIAQFFDVYRLTENVNIISWAFIVSCLINAAWIFAWHYEKLPLSLVLMLVLLAVLIIINFKIIPLQYGITKAAFGVYLGWICIATIANVAALLVKYNWRGWGIPDEVWAIIMIAVGAFITSWAIIRMHNPFIGIAVVWAFIGIIIKRQSDYPAIVLAAIFGVVVVATLTVWMFVKSNPESILQSK